MNMSTVVLCSVNRSYVVQLLWPVSSPTVCGVSGCQKVYFWHKCPLWGFRHSLMWFENDNPVKAFSSQNTLSKETGQHDWICFFDRQ